MLKIIGQIIRTWIVNITESSVARNLVLPLKTSFSVHLFHKIKQEIFTCINAGRSQLIENAMGLFVYYVTQFRLLCKRRTKKYKAANFRYFRLLPPNYRETIQRNKKFRP